MNLSEFFARRERTGISTRRGTSPLDQEPHQRSARGDLRGHGHRCVGAFRELHQARAHADHGRGLWPGVPASVIPLRTIPTGVVYAIWSGMGIVLISTVSWPWFRRTLGHPALLGISLILLGVVIVNVFSTTMGH